MILRLIGPEDVFEYDYWQTSRPPAVISTGDRVWVRGGNSTADKHLYYEQLGYEVVSLDSLRKIG